MWNDDAGAGKLVSVACGSCMDGDMHAVGAVLRAVFQLCQSRSSRFDSCPSQSGGCNG